MHYKGPPGGDELTALKEVRPGALAVFVMLKKEQKGAR